MNDLKKISSITTVFSGGETENGRIEFYEYSRSSYALARLIATVESFRRTGRVPGRISGASNVEVFTQLPEQGSWSYVNNIFRAANQTMKLDVTFSSLYSWALGRSLDNMDLFNSNSDAIYEGDTGVDLELASSETTKMRKKSAKNTPPPIPESGVRQLTKGALEATRDAQKADKLNRITLETDIAVARQARKNREIGGYSQLEEAKQDYENVVALSQEPGVELFDEEISLLNALNNFASVKPESEAVAAEQAARIQYAANDLEPRLNRRLVGDRLVSSAAGVDEEQLDRLASRARPLVKEIVLPLRRSPTDMDMKIGKAERRIIHIDEVRGRMISDSILSKDTYEIDVFVIEYNRVTHSGRCTITNMGIDVPFSLNRQLLRRLTIKAIDALKEENRTFFARPYLDDDGAIRSLLVEDIAE